MAGLARVLGRLRKLRIRGASDYAEILVAEAVGGERVASGVNRGFDVVSPKFGKVEVKCRKLPEDGRIEERIEVSINKEGRFDHLAIVVFHSDFAVKGAVLVPYRDVWQSIQQSRYRRISFATARELNNALDITRDIRRAAER